MLHSGQTDPTPSKSSHGESGSIMALEVVAIDFTLMDQASDGRESALVMADIFTKFTVAAATKNQKA